jgi:hypothetical protein
MYLIDITDFTQIFEDEDRVAKLGALIEEELQYKGIDNDKPRTISILASITFDDIDLPEQSTDDVGGF